MLFDVGSDLFVSAFEFREQLFLYTWVVPVASGNNYFCIFVFLPYFTLIGVVWN